MLQLICCDHILLSAQRKTKSPKTYTPKRTSGPKYDGRALICAMFSTFPVRLQPEAWQGGFRL